MIIVSCSIQPLLIQENNEKFSDYEERIYSEFKSSFDYISLNFTFNEKIIKFRYLPIIDGKEEVFWHIITTDNSGKRIKDTDRYSRIRWAEYLLFYCYENNDECSKVWIRKKRRRIHIWCTSLDYLVVLEERNDYILFITAYPVNRQHTREKLLSEYNRCDEKYKL